MQLRAPVSLEGYAPALERAAARPKHCRLALGRRDARCTAAPAALFDLLEEVRPRETLTLRRDARSARHRLSYRPRRWDMRAGTIELPIPKLRQGSYFPALLKPRRRAERALLLHESRHDDGTARPCCRSEGCTKRKRQPSDTRWQSHAFKLAPARLA